MALQWRYKGKKSGYAAVTNLAPSCCEQRLWPPLQSQTQTLPANTLLSAAR